MKTKRVCSVGFLLALVPTLMAGADTTTKATAPQLSAAQIVEKNVSARGGLERWRAVQTFEMKGKLQAGGNRRSTIPIPGTKIGQEVGEHRLAEQAELPFVMELSRGRKKRLEIQFNGQTAVQVYDGTQGWKVRPFLNRHEVEKFTADELKAASHESDLDGYLIDYAAKGSQVELAGVEQVEGRSAYKLKVTDKNGYPHHIWVDAQTFLEVKVEGEPRRLDGKYHSVAVFLRDYRSVNGLMMPYLMETTVDGVKDSEKIKFEEIVSNPKLDATQFAMPR
ncbi:MAG TPA: outer membrane lipoprotein-sorting protein [Candidatus Binatia bacterium]|nr:outer membrane lipoprotein-sorting protein [Candidatus Binatia bacterium]